MSELSLEPCPLHELAEYMRDRTWVDLRVPDLGLLERVRIIEIKVYVTREEIIVQQHWVDDSGRHRAELTLDSEDIWQAQPTGCSLFDVKPLTVAKERSADEKSEKIIDAVFDAVMAEFGVRPGDLLDSNDWSIIHHRHQAIIVLYEMTDLGPKEICTKVFRYGSQMPYQSAVGKAMARDYDTMKLSQKAHGFRTGVRKIGDRADEALKPLQPESFRRTHAHARDYNPVLA